MEVFLKIKNLSSGSFSGDMMTMPSKKWSDIAAEEDNLQSVNAGTASSTLPMTTPSKKWSDIAAEEDDLQSVNAGTASSTVKSTVMSDGEASENETQQSDVSRLSKWRPSSSKSSGKKRETAD